jgi:hypothetical protein
LNPGRGGVKLAISRLNYGTAYIVCYLSYIMGRDYCIDIVEEILENALFLNFFKLVRTLKVSCVNGLYFFL